MILISWYRVPFSIVNISSYFYYSHSFMSVDTVCMGIKHPSTPQKGNYHPKTANVRIANQWRVSARSILICSFCVFITLDMKYATVKMRTFHQELNVWCEDHVKNLVLFGYHFKWHCASKYTRVITCFILFRAATNIEYLPNSGWLLDVLICES